MKFLMRVAAMAALCALAIAAIAQTDPKAVLKEIADQRAAKMKELRDAGKQLDQATFNAMQADAKAKAGDAVKTVDPAKVDAKDAYAWAQLFQMAGDVKGQYALAKKFLTSNPSADDAFQAQMLALNAAEAQGNADALLADIAAVKPPNAIMSRSFASTVTGRYLDTIEEKKGQAAALKVLDMVERGLVFEDPKEYAKRMLEAQKQRRATSGATAMTQEEEAKALTDLETAGARSNDALKASIANKRTLLTLNGSVAPALKVERQYGDFKGLEAYKGKVVILDYFAHW